jgi:hypothetical protein
MSKIPLAIPLFLAFLLTVTMTYAQAGDITAHDGECLRPPKSFGAAAYSYIAAIASPNGENTHLAEKHCFSQELDVSGEKTKDSSSDPAAHATGSYSYHVGRGRFNLQAEVNVAGHHAPQGNKTVYGWAGGNVQLMLWWVDYFNLHSATTKPVVITKKGADIDPSQVVKIRLRIFNNGQNECSGGGAKDSVYKTSVLFKAQASANYEFIGGHEDMDVDSNCKRGEQQETDDIEVVLGNGQFAIELAANILINSTAKQDDGYSPKNDLKVKLGEYQICYQVLNGPPDLKITSASGVDYTCPAHIPGSHPIK